MRESYSGANNAVENPNGSSENTQLLPSIKPTLSTVGLQVQLENYSYSDITRERGNALYNEALARVPRRKDSETLQSIHCDDFGYASTVLL
jgi:hypothetical protein